MARESRVFTKASLGTTFSASAYTDDGKVWYWTRNNRPVPLDAAGDYGIPIDPAAQKGAEEAYLDLVLTGYRKAMANHTPDAEEAHEMRAAFGPGQGVVDVVAGKKYRT